MAGYVVLAWLLPLLSIASGREAEPRYDFEIPALKASVALELLARQSNAQLLFPYDVVESIQTQPVSGRYTLAEALSKLLEGTGLISSLTTARVITITASKTNADQSGERGMGRTNKWSLLSAIAAFLAGGAHAGRADEQSGAQPAEVLEEVVVTARFRTESVQNIGAAITPISAEMIEQDGITDFSDIARHTPGLSSTDRGPNTHEVLLRGIANQTTERVTDISAVSPLVSQFLDDVPFSSASASQRDVNLFDFARVEVLRGPQPTFFGEGSVGGTVRYISADPDLTAGPFADPVIRVGASNTQHGGWNESGNAAATFNPVPGVFGVRAVVNWRDDDGFIDSPVRHANNTNTFHSTGGHLVALFKPDDALSVRFAAHISRDRTGDLAYVDVGSRPSDLVFNTPVNGASRDDIDLYSLKAGYEAGPVTITSITGYYRRDRESTGYDPANSGFFGGLFGTPINILIENPIRDRSWTQELRFVSNFHGPLNFTGGLFYKHKNSAVVEALTSPDGTFAPFQEIPGEAIFNASTTYKTVQYSGFLEGTYAATDRLRLIAGARYVHEKVDSSVNQYLSVGGITPPIATLDFATFLPASGLPTAYTFNLSKVLPRAAIEYDLSKQAMVYTSASTGVRNGNLNTAVSAFQAAGGGTAAFDRATFSRLLVFHEDKVLSYELGVKTRWLEDRLTVNGAAYFTRYDTPQIYTATPFVLIANGPDAHIKGMELEANFRANDIVTLYANGSWTQAEFVGSALLIPTLAPAITADVVAGNRLANVPTWAYSVGVNTRYPLGRVKLIGHVGYDYVADRNASAENFVSTELPAIGILNARLGIQADHWSVVGYVANATNAIEPQSINATGGAAFVNNAGQLDAPANAVSVNRPRTIGVEVTYRP